MINLHGWNDYLHGWNDYLHGWIDWCTGADGRPGWQSVYAELSASQWRPQTHASPHERPGQTKGHPVGTRIKREQNYHHVQGTGVIQGKHLVDTAYYME